jgi:hypothetical protein
VCPSRGVVYRKTMEFTLENGKSIKPQNNLEILASQEVKWVRRIRSNCTVADRTISDSSATE